jgi:hypothetical protein
MIIFYNLKLEKPDHDVINNSRERDLCDNRKGIRMKYYVIEFL